DEIRRVLVMSSVCLHSPLLSHQRTILKLLSSLKFPDSILTLFATQRDDPAILSHSFDSCPALLIRGSPFGGNIFGVSDFGKLFLVSIQPPKQYHSFLDRVCVDRVGRIVRHFG